MAKDKKSDGSRRKLLQAARKHQDALQAAGLSVMVIDKYEIALKGLQAQGKGPSPAAQVLIKDIQQETGEIQAAVRKEFPGHAQFQPVFRAGKPMPTEAPAVRALGGVLAEESA